MIGVMIPNVFAQDSEIPAWIKNNAGWWADGQIDDSSFLQGIQYLIQEGIMVISTTETSDSSGSEGVPAWIKNNAGWWADGQIDDNSFVSGIQWLVSSGIIVVEQEQTQPAVTGEEIQKLADEYWACWIKDPIPSSSCFGYDEDYAIGGIEKTVYISSYDVVCNTNLCGMKLYEHYDVDVKLEKFQDENLHKQLFDAYVSITPKQILDEVVFLSIETDGYGDPSSASVSRDELNPSKFTLRIDPIDMAPDGSVNEQFYKSAMIHENAHILSLGSSQGDNDSISSGLYKKPYTEFRKVFQEKTSVCANYYSYSPGCMNDTSYMNLFFQEFWVDIYPSFKWLFEFDDRDEFVDHNALFYKKYKTQFVAEYATSNPHEDFAESFTAFVLKEKPTKSAVKILENRLEIVVSTSTIAGQKILFFYDFPELVEMRDFIRSNLSLSIEN